MATEPTMPPGYVYGSGHDVITETFAAGGDVDFGAPVWAADDGRVATAADTGELAGIALHTHAATGVGKYAEGDAVNVAILGKIWSKAVGTVAIGDALEAVAGGVQTAGDGEAIGIARSAADDGEPVVVHLNFTPTTKITGDQ